MQGDILSWLNFDFKYQQHLKNQEELLVYVPEALRRSLYAHLHQNILYRILFLRQLCSGMCPSPCALNTMPHTAGKPREMKYTLQTYYYYYNYYYYYY